MRTEGRAGRRAQSALIGLLRLGQQGTREVAEQGLIGHVLLKVHLKGQSGTGERGGHEDAAGGMQEERSSSGVGGRKEGREESQENVERTERDSSM